LIALVSRWQTRQTTGKGKQAAFSSVLTKGGGEWALCERPHLSLEDLEIGWPRDPAGVDNGTSGGPGLRLVNLTAAERAQAMTWTWGGEGGVVRIT
jgi:hypothetical protein